MAVQEAPACGRERGGGRIHSIRRCSNIYAPCPSPITIEIWGSILDYFFINHTLRPGTLARRSPFRSNRQPAELLSEVNSLHRINTT